MNYPFKRLTIITEDSKENFLLKNTRKTMPRVSAYLCEHAIVLLQGDVRTEDDKQLQ